MLKVQTHNHLFRLNGTTDKKVHPDKNRFEVQNPIFHFFLERALYIYICIYYIYIYTYIYVYIIT